MRSEDSQLPTNQLMRSNTVKQKLRMNAMEHLMHLPKEKRSHVKAYGQYRTVRVTQRLQLFTPNFSPLTVLELIHGLTSSVYREHLLAQSKPALQVLLLELMDS